MKSYLTQEQIIASNPRIFSKQVEWHCGKGWNTIIAILTLELFYIYSFPKGKKKPLAKILSIQERGGELSVCLSILNDEIQEVLTIAILKSQRTCEFCGEKGTLRFGPRPVINLCDTCLKEVETNGE